MIIFGEDKDLIHKLMIFMDSNVLMLVFELLEALSGVLFYIFGTNFGVLKKDANISRSFLHKSFIKRKIIKKE